MKSKSIKVFVAVAATLSILTSCTSYDNGHGLSAAAGVGAGALAWEASKYESDDKRMLYTGIAGLGTFALGELVRSGVMNNAQEKYALGYRMGEADTVKRQYEILQNFQKWRKGDPRTVKTYEFPGVDHRDGINYAPHSVKLRVEE
jgi:hypothetical protein